MLHCLQGFDAWLSWDTNPLYALLHEACYCNGGASQWAAQKVMDSSFSEHFDAALAAANGRPVLFTGGASSFPARHQHLK